MGQLHVAKSAHWSIIPMTARDCGPLQTPLNGSSLGSETTFPNVIHFKCDEGFVLQGSNARRCLANGSWSGVKTFCKGKDRRKRNFSHFDGMENDHAARSCLDHESGAGAPLTTKAQPSRVVFENHHRQATFSWLWHNP